MLLPLTKVDVLELALDDAAHFARVFRSDAIDALHERGRPVFDGDGERDMPMLGPAGFVSGLNTPSS